MRSSRRHLLSRRALHVPEEKANEGEKNVEGKLAALLWPRVPFCGEICVACAETSWCCVMPSNLQQVTIADFSALCKALSSVAHKLTREKGDNAKSIDKLLRRQVEERSVSTEFAE